MSIVEFLSQPLWQRLGLTLVHFLWQGLAVAVLAGVFVRVFKLKHGNARYGAYLLAFIAMIICPVVTFTAIDIPISPNTELVTGAESAEAIATSTYTALPAGDILPEAETSSPGITTLANSIPLSRRISDWLNVSMPWVLVIWMVGVVVLSVRLLMGFVGIYRWRHHLQPLPERLAQRIASLSERLSMRGFSRVFISPTVLQAMAVGYLRPMVLLPAAMVTQMQPEMLEAVIAHELAHIRRLDLWVNLAQRVTETLLFYHPAVWWLSICLRRERELCCDELAVKATGRRLTYASTLESVGRDRFMAKQPILAAGLGQDNKPTLGRVRHILGLKPTQRNCPFWLAGVITVLFLAALVIPTTLALTSKPKGNTCMQLVGEGLPAGWKLDYDSGIRPDGIKVWRGGMARNLAELRAIPKPTNEYDESWKKERIEFEITSKQGKRVGSIIIWNDVKDNRIILSPDKYSLSYTRARRDPNSGCYIPLDRVKFPIDLNQPGMYQLKFSPKLRDSSTFVSGKYPPTTCGGKVIDVDGSLLGGAKVAAYEMFFDMAGSLNLRLVEEAATKADGEFLFKATPSVKKSRSMGGVVVAQKKGFALGWAEWPLYGAQQVTITLGKPVKLAGFIADENAEGIANADVRAVLFKKKTSENEKTRWLPGLGPLPWLTVRTDREGQFEFNNIPEDIRADFVVSAAGFSTIYTHKPENLSAGYEGAEFIAGQTDIRVELTAEGRIEGKVIDSKSGEGVAGVKLAVVPAFSPFFFERFVCTSKQDGTFNIGGLRSGKYLMRGDFPKVYANVKSGQKSAVQVEIKEKRNQKELSKFKKTLAIGVTVEGVTVELVGVCDHPSEGKQWWRPDGSLLKNSPYDDDFGRAFPKDGEKGYKFAVKYSGMAGRDIDAMVIPLNAKTTNGGALFSTSKKNGKENIKYLDGSLDEKIVWLGAAFDEEIVNCDIRIGVCFGDWKRNYRYETDQSNDAVEWVTFKNVSLKPNFKTDVQVEVEKAASNNSGGDSKRHQLVTFKEGMSIREALRFLGKAYKKNIILSDKVAGQVPVNELYNVTFEEALQAILGTHKYIIDGHFIRVYTEEEFESIYPEEKTNSQVEVEKPDVQVEGESGWGEAVEGVQVRLRSNRARWNVDETITWKIDVRNTGKRHFKFALAYEAVKIHVDGRIFDLPSIRSRVRLYDLKPGQEHRNIFFKVDRRLKFKDHPFELQPGKHAVKITLAVRPAKGERGDSLQVTSNPVEIEILPADSDVEQKTDVQVEGKKRALHFPGTFSVGTLYIRDPITDDWYKNREKIEEAKGEISVPARKQVKLIISESAVEHRTAS
ncbi:MAG: hypothetical protein FVQ85_11430 [Planctomycetes bacterium]|nr:hypothetical protein [Planctomycetota bacterium]